MTFTEGLVVAGLILIFGGWSGYILQDKSTRLTDRENYNRRHEEWKSPKR